MFSSGHLQWELCFYHGPFCSKVVWGSPSWKFNERINLKYGNWLPLEVLRWNLVDALSVSKFSHLLKPVHTYTTLLTYLIAKRPACTPVPLSSREQALKGFRPSQSLVHLFNLFLTCVCACFWCAQFP